MKILCSLLLITCLMQRQAMAQESNFAVALIPDSLLQNAHAVVRYLDESYTIIAPDNYTLLKKYAVTVLDEKGKKSGDYSEYYSKQNTINSISGTLYDKDGKILKHLKNRDVIDAAAFGTSFVTDFRVKHYSFITPTYPYTVEYEVEEEYVSTLNLQPFIPLKDNYCSLEQADLTIQYPATFPLRYKNYNLPVSPKVIDTNHNKLLSLTIKGIKAIKETEEYATAIEKILPTLLLATDTFSLFDHAGNMTTWQDLGKFIYQLNYGRDVLTDEVKKTVHQLTDTCHNQQQKITILYKYLQDNTRYVSIQLGIGGWQTFDAKFVSEKKYGDCKALSNFMLSLLKEAGIAANAVWVNAGLQETFPIDESFPCNRFNHAILCVPTATDTTWLECTSHYLPAGYLSGFTGNRKVLMITPEGGVIVNTPNYDAATNVLKRTAVLNLNANDEVIGEITISNSGMFWDAEYNKVTGAAKSNIEKHFNSLLGFSNYKATDYKIGNLPNTRIPLITEGMKVTATTEVTHSSNNLLLSTGVFLLPHLATTQTDTLQQEFEIYQGYKIIDSQVINLSGSYRLKQNAQEMNMEYPFGSFNVTCNFINHNTLIKVSTLQLNEGVYPASQFKHYKKLRNESNRSSKNSVILTKL